MKILFCRTSIPETSTSAHGFFYEKSLRKSHDVITYGPNLPESMYEKLGFTDVRNLVEADIPYFTSDIEEVLDRLPWMPDMLLWTDNFYWFLIKGLKRVPFPTACFFLDPQYMPELKIEMARQFDSVFVSQKTEVARYGNAGVKNVSWLTHACDPDVHGRKTNLKEYDISFVGTMNSVRSEKIEMLKTRFSVHTEKCHGSRMAEVFSQSRIVFNISAVGEINMRIFESMASGSMLLTDEAPGSGLSELFEDGRHLVFYRNDDELMKLAGYYLKNDAEREKIAGQGMREVLLRHTYDRRVQAMIDAVESYGNPRAGGAFRDYKAAWGQDEAVIASYKTRIECGQDSAELYVDLGLALQRRGSPEEAIMCYRRALDLDSGYAPAYNNLGVALKETGETGKAIEAYQKAVDCDPGYADAYYNMGNAFFLYGAPDKAMKCYRRTIELCPGHAAAYNNLATIYLGEGDFESHMACFKKALELLD